MDIVILDLANVPSANGRVPWGAVKEQAGK